MTFMASVKIVSGKFRKIGNLRNFSPPKFGAIRYIVYSHLVEVFEESSVKCSIELLREGLHNGRALETAQP